MSRHAVAVCAIVLGGSFTATAKDQVVYRVVEDVETAVYPESREDALVKDLEAVLESRERETREQLEDLDGAQYTGVVTYGQGIFNDQAIKKHGVQRVVPESGGFGGWLARKLGMETSPEDTLPTFEEHYSGIARVQSTFVGDKDDPRIPKTLNGAKVEQAADRVALVIHASEGDNDFKSDPIHIKVKELEALTKDPKAALDTPLGELIRSSYRHQVIRVDEGGVDHTGVEPVIVVRGVKGPGKLGPVLATLPESLLDRTNKLSTLPASKVTQKRWNRERNQFQQERIQAIFDRRNQKKAELALKDKPKPPSSGRGNPGTIHDTLFSSVDRSGRKYDVHQINDGNGNWRLVATPPGGTPNIGSPAYQSSVHGSWSPPPTSKTQSEGGRGKVDKLFD